MVRLPCAAESEGRTTMNSPRAEESQRRERTAEVVPAAREEGEGELRSVKELNGAKHTDVGLGEVLFILDVFFGS